MYLPKHFTMDHDAAAAVLHNAGAAQLVTLTSGGMVATTLPLLYIPSPDGDGLGVLHGHVARANRQWADSLAPSNGPEALVLFAQSDAYVSPSAYATKRETGKVVPTWNYVSVQVRGTLVVHDDPVWTRSLVHRLTTHHEAKHIVGRDPGSVTGRAWSIDDAPADYIEGLLRAIVGIEIVITSIEGKAKLSQNRSSEDVQGVIQDLQQGSPADQYTAAQIAEAAQLPTRLLE